MKTISEQALWNLLFLKQQNKETKVFWNDFKQSFIEFLRNLNIFYDFQVLESLKGYIDADQDDFVSMFDFYNFSSLIDFY